MSASDTPKCSKCQREITTGMMCLLCPHGSACELWPKDVDKSSELFAYQMWEDFAKKHVARLEAEISAIKVAAQKELPEEPVIFDHASEHGQCVSRYDYLFLRAFATALIAREKEARKNADRYEYVRRLNAYQFAELYKRCMIQDVRFDEAIDAAAKREE